MTDLLRLAVVLDLLGVWMFGSDLLYELLCQYLLRRTPTGGAAVVLTMLVYGSMYCLVLGMLWALWAPSPAAPG
jgi:hypothetical protein